MVEVKNRGVYSSKKIAECSLHDALREILDVMGSSSSKCQLLYLSKLVSQARVLLCPHTSERMFSQTWDHMFSYVLIHCLARCTLEETWERHFREILIGDLNLTAPYDGSEGQVVKLMQTMRSILEAVTDNDRNAVLLLLQRSKLRQPVLQMTDEFGWTLLHHASFHCATDVMKLLIGEGISMNEYCNNKQSPLHVASSALHYGSILTLSNLGGVSSVTLSAKNSRGHTPLQCLLHSISVGIWCRKLSSQQLLHSIDILLIEDSHMWKLNYQDALHNDMTIFSTIMLYSDAFVAEALVKRAFESLYIQRERVADQDLYTKDNANETELKSSATWTILENQRDSVVFEVKRVILHIIRRKKYRILKSILNTFGEMLLQDYICPSTSQNHNSYLFHCQAGVQMLTPHPNSVFFLHQCLTYACASGSLRILALVLAAGALNKSALYAGTFLSQQGWHHPGHSKDDSIVSASVAVAVLQQIFTEADTSVQLHNLSCSSVFLLVPILNGDSSMLRLLLDYMDQSPMTALWTFVPSSPGMVSDMPLLLKAIECFKSWCDEGKLRRDFALVSLSHTIFSPIATACLCNQPYMLQLLLQKHWCHSRTSLEHSINNYLYRGVNPVICCFFSSSISCLKVMLDYFGEIHFTSLCNTKDDMGLLPLFSLLLLLRGFLKNRVFNKVSQGSKCDPSPLAKSILHYYDYFAPVHSTNLLEMLQIILPRTQFQGQSWQHADDIEEELRGFDKRFNDLKQHKSLYIPDHVRVTSNSFENEPVGYETTFQLHQLSNQWAYLQSYMSKFSFKSSLRVLLNRVCVKRSNGSMTQSESGNELRMNRQFQNITRAVVLLLHHENQTFHSRRPVEIDWWAELTKLIGNDYASTDDTLYWHDMHHRSQRRGRSIAENMTIPKGSKFVHKLLSLQYKKVNNDILNKANICIQATKLWISQGNPLCPPKQINSAVASNCFMALDLLHKWSMLVIEENALLRQNSLSSFVDLNSNYLLREDAIALDHIMDTLKDHTTKSSDSPFMCVLGEAYSPPGFDITVCAAAALLQDLSPGQTEVLNPSPSPSDTEEAVSSDTGASPKLPAELSTNVKGRGLGPKSTPIDIRLLCDNVLCLLIEDERICDYYSAPSIPAFALPDILGVTPLLAMCTYELWKSAEKIISYKAKSKIIVDLEKSSSDKSISPSGYPLLFPGGLKDYLYLHDNRFSRRSLIHVGDELQHRLHWGVDTIKTTNASATNQANNNSNTNVKTSLPLRIVDALDLAIAKHADEFVLCFLRLFPQSRNIEELMSFAYVMDNTSLCVAIGMQCAQMTHVPCCRRRSTFCVNGYYRTHCFGAENKCCSNRRFRNNISDFSSGYSCQKGSSLHEEICLKKRTVSKSLHRRKFETTLECGSLYLIDLYRWAQEESLRLNKDHQERVAKFLEENESRFQIHQKDSISKYGFCPVYDGCFSGLCLSYDGRIWLMDGSLMSQEDFFSDTDNLIKALPVPLTRTSHIDTSISGFDLTHSVVSHAWRLPEEVLDLLLDMFALPDPVTILRGDITIDAKDINWKRMARQRYLTGDTNNRSPVFLAISNNRLALATSLLSKAVLPVGTALADSKANSISPLTDGLASLFLATVVNRVNILEKDLCSRLQGDYRGKHVSGGLMHLLMVYLDRVGMLWEYLQSKCDISSMSRLIYDPSAHLLDCFQRAKTVLLLLNIPFSQLHVKKPINEGQPSKIDSRFKDLSPEQMRHLVPWRLSVDLQKLTREWVSLRLHRASEANTGSASTPSLQSFFAADVQHASKLKKPLKLCNPLNETLRDLESSLMVYKSINLSLVTYGFSVTNKVGEKKKELRGSVSSANVFEATIPPLIWAETRHLRDHAKKNPKVDCVKEMTKVLTMYRHHTEEMNQAVQCAYTILEFARTLSMARMLVTLTQESVVLPTKIAASSFSSSPNEMYTPSSLPLLQRKPAKPHTDAERSPHPVDAARQAVLAARKRVETTTAAIEQIVVSNKSKPTLHTEDGNIVKRANASIAWDLLTYGANSHLRVLDGLNLKVVQGFLKLGSEISPMFNNLRRIICEAFSILIGIPSTSSKCSRTRMASLLARYVTYNCSYDERELLEGRHQPLPNTEEGLASTALSSSECDQLAEALLDFFQNLTIKQFVGVQAPHNIDLETPTPVVSKDMIEALFQHMRRHPTVFTHAAIIPMIPHWCLSALGNDRPRGQAIGVPLTKCPCATESVDLKNLLAYRDNDPTPNAESTKPDSNYSTIIKPASNDTDSFFKMHLLSLNAGYRLAEKFIQATLTVMGIHSMSHVYMMDFKNVYGGGMCSAYIALCYTPSSFSGRSHTPIQEKLREEALVQAFRYLRACKVDLDIDGSIGMAPNFFDSKTWSGTSTYNSLSSQMFGQYSELQYCIVCAAVLGKAALLEQFLLVENQNSSRNHSNSYRQQSHLVWYTIMLCPPPSTLSAEKEEYTAYHRYANIVGLLLENGFGIQAPIGAQMTVLNIAALKQLGSAVDIILKVFIGTDSESLLTSSMLNLGAFQYLALSHDASPSTLGAYMTLQGKGASKATGVVSLESFAPDSISDSKIVAAMMEAIHCHINQYKNFSKAVNTQERLSQKPDFQIESVEDLLDMTVHSTSSLSPPGEEHRLEWPAAITLHSLSVSLARLLHSVPTGEKKVLSRKRNCPLTSLVRDLTSEIQNIKTCDAEVCFKTPIQTLRWSNLHFFLASQSAVKFELLFSFFYSGSLKPRQSNSSSHTSSSSSQSSDCMVVPCIDQLGGGNLPCDLLHYVCFYGLHDTLEVLLGSAWLEENISINDKIFFSPLSNFVSPVEIAVETGNCKCVQILLRNAPTNMPLSQGGAISWKMLYHSLAKGLGGDAMCEILLSSISSFYIRNEKQVDLRQALDAPIQEIPRSGINLNETLLQVCARRGYVTSCAHLIQCGANVYRRHPATGMSALSNSIACNQREVSRLLSSHYPEENSASEKMAVAFRRFLLKKNRKRRKQCSA